MQAKIFAPAATATEFGRTSTHVESYDYDPAFPRHHTSLEAADLLLQLIDSDAAVGLVDRESLAFRLGGPRLPHAGDSADNQKL